MEEAQPTCDCPIYNQACFQTLNNVVPYNYDTIYLKYPNAQSGEVMSATIMPQSLFDSVGTTPQQFNFLTSTGTGVLWKSYGNNLGVYAYTENTGIPTGVLTPITLPTGTSFVDVFVVGYGGSSQVPPPYFTTTGQIFYVAENGTYGSGAVVYFPRLPVSTFSLLLQNNTVQFYYNNELLVKTTEGAPPTAGVAVPPSILTPGTGGGGGYYSLLSTQFPYLASNGVQGKDGRVLNVPLNTSESTQVVSNLITGNLTNIQFNSTSGVTDLSRAGNSGVIDYSFPTSAGIQYTETINPGGLILRCYAY